MSILSITKNKNFLADCKKYEELIDTTKDSELTNLYRQLKRAADNLDAAFNTTQITSINFQRHVDERAQLSSLRKKIEKRITEISNNRR